MVNISNLTINSSMIASSYGTDPLTRGELANLFCINFYTYMITILIIACIYSAYRQDFKEYLVLGFKPLINYFDSKQLKKYFTKLPNDIEEGLAFLTFTGCGIMIYFYYDYANLPQKIVLWFFITWFIILRIIDLLVWISKKIIAFYVKRQLGKVSEQMNNLIGNVDEDEYIDLEDTED